MPKHCIFELGFNKASTHEFETGRFSLQMCLMEVPNGNPKEGKPRWVTEFNPGDSISFRIWDIGPTGNPTTTAVTFWAGFFSNSESSKLAEGVFEEGGNPIFTAQGELIPLADDDRTIAYPNVQRGWSVGEKPLGKEFKFKGPNPDQSTSIYVLQMRVEATIGITTLRNFRHDPEVIVGPFGS